MPLQSPNTSISNVFGINLDSALTEIQLPTLKAGEHHNGESTVIFINPAGMTIRIANQQYKSLYRFAHLARPIGSIKIGRDCRLDLIQGGQDTTSEVDAKYIYEQGKQAGIEIEDIYETEEEKKAE